MLTSAMREVGRRRILSCLKGEDMWRERSAKHEEYNDRI